MNPSPPDESPGLPGRWLVLALVAVDYFVLYGHRSLLSYLKRPLTEDLGLTAAQFGWLNPAFFLPYALAQVGAGYLGDRFARRTILLGSLLASASALAAMGLAVSFEQMVAFRVALGVAQAASVPAIASALGDSFTPRSRSTAVAFYLVSYNLGLVLAATYGGRVADRAVWVIPLGALGGEVAVAGWRMTLLLGAGVGLAGAAAFWALFPEPPRAERGPGQPGALPFVASLRAVLAVRTYLALLAVFVLATTVTLAVQHWLAGYLAARFALSLEDAGFHATAWTQGGTVLGLLLGGVLADALARRRVSGRQAVQAAGLLAAAPSLVAVGTGDALGVLFAPMLLFGLGVGLYQANLWTTTFEVVRAQTRSTAIGLLNVASGLFGFWCNPLIGLYEERGGSVGVALASLSVLEVAGVCLLAYSSRRLLPRDYIGPLRPGD